MYPSQVRERILRDHEELRARLCVLEAAVDALERDPAKLKRVVTTARSLLKALIVHTELEDVVLGEALLEIDAWGPERARALREHHAVQRRELHSLVTAYGRVNSYAELAQLTCNWILDVRSDMQHEESHILTTALLHDDPIAVDLEAG